MKLHDKDTIRYIGGELISSDKIPLGTIGTIKGNQIIWDNGVVGRYSKDRTYKQIAFV